MAAPARALWDALFILSRIYRAAAVMFRSTFATQKAFNVFCLEYFLKGSIYFYIITLMISRPDLARKDQVTLMGTSILDKILFCTPILVGWGLKKTLEEWKLEDNASLEQPQQRQYPQQRQQQPSPAHPEENTGSLTRVRSWPRTVIGTYELTVFIDSLQTLGTLPHYTSSKICVPCLLVYTAWEF